MLNEHCAIESHMSEHFARAIGIKYSLNCLSCVACLILSNLGIVLPMPLPNIDEFSC